ncbi:FUN14 domain-containing protein [bacterium]|jgi:uncharacterized membrane protein (Fun14 family)|nr:FUN14 domain-containing protein [bacterium]
MEVLIPIIGTLGVGGFLGWAAASFLKTTGRLIGCAIGLVFILMQVLAYYGIAQWHWDAIGHAVGGVGHAAQAGGKVLWKIMTYNLPFTGGFGAGFWWGMKH